MMNNEHTRRGTIEDVTKPDPRREAQELERRKEAYRLWDAEQRARLERVRLMYE